MAFKWLCFGKFHFIIRPMNGKWILRLWLGLLCFLMGGSLPAQFLPFRNWDPSDGLASSQVWTVCQDNQGYLWIGCTGGLSRFNGRQFKTYRTDDGLPQNMVEASAVDAQGRLWVASLNGPCRYDRDRDRFIPPRELGGRVRRFVLQGKELYMLMDSALYRLGPDDRWLSVAVPGLKDEWVALEADDRGIYAGTASGRVCAWRPEFPDPAGGGQTGAAPRVFQLPAAVNGLTVAPGGELLIAADSGLYTLDRDWRAVSGPLAGTGGDRLLNAMVDVDNSLWLGATTTLLHVTGTEIERFDGRSGISGVPVWSTYRDRENNLWFGTNHGVTQLAGRLTEVFDARSGLTGKSIISLAWDPGRSCVWFGTTDGLFSYRQGQVTPFPLRQDFFRKYYVWAIQPAADGQLWLGTEYGGVVITDGASWRVIDRSAGLPGNEVVDLLRDSRGVVWVGTRQGLGRIDGSSIRAYTRADGLPVNYVRCILEVPGRPGLYLGTGGGGLVHFDGARFSTLTTGRDPRLVSIYDLCSHRGRLWLATNQGLFNWSGSGEFRYLGQDAGLPNESCTVLQEAGDDFLWVGTDGGAALVHAGAEKVVRVLPRAHGLAGDEFTTHNSCIVDGEDNFWFGQFGGATRLRRDLLFAGSRHGVSPLVLLDRAEVYVRNEPEKALRELKDARLPSGLRSIRFLYDVLWFRDPQNIRVSSRLSGFDDAFSAPGQSYQREYTNLPPGSYRLEIQYFNGNQPLGRQTLASFWVEPPFWQNPLFQLILLTAGGLLIYAGFRWRYRKIEREKERLTELVRQATHELEKKNTLLARLATTDELTGLYNRRFFMRAILQEVRRLARSRPGETLTLLMLDLDHFKMINDVYGHESGDRVLQFVARCLKSVLRVTDVSARFGGEEFVVMLPQTPLVGGRLVADKIRRIMEANPVERDGQEIHCTISIGMLTVSSPVEYSEDLVQQLLQRVDIQLYRAKAQGRNRIMVEGEE